MQTEEMAAIAAPEVVADLVSMAWGTFIDSPIAPIDEPVTAEHLVCASISINGPWSATLLLYCDRDVATASTARVLGMEPGDVDRADMLDIMGELANIVGGNLKGAISDDTHAWKLSLPVVSDGMQAVPGSELTTSVSFVGEWGLIGCEVRQHAA